MHVHTTARWNTELKKPMHARDWKDYTQINMSHTTTVQNWQHVILGRVDHPDGTTKQVLDQARQIEDSGLPLSRVKQGGRLEVVSGDEAELAEVFRPELGPG